MQQTNSSTRSTFFKSLATLSLTTVIGAAIGFGSTYLTTPKWTATAEFDKPTIVELGNYYSLYSTYQFLNGGDGVAYQVVKNDKAVLTLSPSSSPKAEKSVVDESYAEFKRNLVSMDVLVNFLSQSEIIKLKAQVENKPITIIAQQVAEQFVFKTDETTNPMDSLSVTSANPEEANKLLADFIQYANQQAKQDLNAELITKWKVLFQQTQTAMEINLGATQNGNQIATQDWKGKLALMKSVQPLDDKLVAYRFIKSPSVPLSPSSPQPILWAMLGALGGALLGLLLVLGRKKRMEFVPNQ